ncbi:hypothetical protein J1N10_01715 [Carboxylicivirga sp. A043]|uniref:hypothetical protein n=1 Tax=Carboxylicivirga litoralis TaxID=2816963 RepID=UPI0021CB57D9|nr:hypothetical protein [Carboxylicivirga sp. A043]MCU4154672.1 hypothetical protein [Carboxylicivirga sp. A043]
MKTVFSILIAVGLMASTTANARERGVIKINKYHNSDLSIISIINCGDASNHLQVINNNTGESVYYESLNTKQTYQKVFDPNQLDNGDYTVLLKGNDYEIQKDFNVQYGRLKDSDVVKDIYTDTRQMKFYIDPNNETLTMGFINADQNDMEFQLVHLDRNKLVENMKVGNKIGYSNKYELSGLRSGQYRATLIAGNTHYHYDFTL